MKKLMEPVSRLDVIKAFTFMNYPNNVRVIRVDDKNWSEDNSKQLDFMLKKAVGFQKFIDNSRVSAHDRDITVYPSGYYVCTYDEVLDRCEYSIKIEYPVNTFKGQTIEKVYLYYIGQDNH